MKKLDSSLSKKLKSYSALAGSMIAVGTSADAQVVYTDIVPDTTIANSMYNLDLNNDAIMDFSLVQQAGTYYGYAYNVVAMYMGTALNAVDTVSGAAAAVNSGISVDSTMTWADSTAANGMPGLLALSVPAAGYNIGNWLGATGKFLPLKFTFGGDIYYGWARLSIAMDASSLIVIDYAYKNNPDHQSITGLTTDVGISESALNGKVDIYSFDKNITVKLDKNVPMNGMIIVRNAEGQEVAKTAISKTETIIPMSEAKTGIYLVTISQNSGQYTKRVLVK